MQTDKFSRQTKIYLRAAVGGSGVSVSVLFHVMY